MQGMTDQMRDEEVVVEADVTEEDMTTEIGDGTDQETGETDPGVETGEEIVTEVMTETEEETGVMTETEEETEAMTEDEAEMVETGAAPETTGDAATAQKDLMIKYQKRNQIR